MIIVRISITYRYFVEIRGKVYIIECKTSFSFQMEEWQDGGIPRHYELQGRHYMATVNVDGVIFLCLHGNSESSFIMRILERDLDQEEELIDQEMYFWEENVLKKQAPDYTEHVDLVLRSIRNSMGIQEGREVNLPAELYENVTQYLTLKEKKAELAKQTRMLETQMKQAYAPVQKAMAGAEKGLLVFDGERYQAGFSKRVTTSINRDSLDALRLKYPEICEEYARTSDSYTFYIKKEKAS